MIESEGATLRYIASGTIKTESVTSGSLPLRLKVIFDGVREIMQRYQPDCASVEIVFVNVNPQSTLLLGQARGAALTALVAGRIDGCRIHRAADEKGDRRPRPGAQGAGAGRWSGACSHCRACRAAMRPMRWASRSAMRIAGASLAALARGAALAPRSHAQYRRGRTY